MNQRSAFTKQILLLSAIVIINPAHAGIKCWKTDKGVRECGYQIPDEYRKTRIEILNKNGIVIRVIAAPKNKEQLAEQARIDKAIAKIAERKRKDRILLRTFTTERDLIIARDNRITAVQSLIEISKSNNNAIQVNLSDLRERAGNYERGGQTLPKKLLSNIKKNESQIASNNAYIKKKENDISKIKKAYKFDLERFNYLKEQQKRK
ncbi:MAG: hypothetical protein ACC653_00840 [Gammaproteobacteria bacterium]